ncbi:HEPN/Toprim-associated domain-containing protein [Asticcacaulis sp. ZE23SCel15]|uniref:HEPN/Toprim-associated domain-containing protein n=1 Tax=Asticcacaulis sp. ZE23SCel15 TaxID=3059027 RepID=UPI00265E0835|nr:HEPN/Toprim-associated domain-containing protein [Asticcacaulis sp. ZE23SCel15]WKL56554.1 HEPN/Toprim-associated domain-containing protein [Asticcacaulis sp. ZE23SCel15]
MGSMIHLSVGRLEIDWGKNSGFSGHSSLFQKGDKGLVPYYYVDEADRLNNDGGYNLVRVDREGLSKPLSRVVDRLKLLGCTDAWARQEFAYFTSLNESDTNAFTYEHLALALATCDVEDMSADYGDGEDFGKFFKRHLFDRLGLDGIVDDADHVRRSAAEAMENLSAYTVLHLLANNPRASQLPVTWQYADVLEGGWARPELFEGGPSANERFLIVTEGSSDATIIRHGLELLYPHLADFFQFIDMKEGYPFTGIGNLCNFAKGLVSIGYPNYILFLFDNDAEGVAGFERARRFSLLSNMRAVKLPDLIDFKRFATKGPEGDHLSDINGRAAAIECYLQPPAGAFVQWNNFNKELGVYQGELVNKGDVMREFLSLKDADRTYDFSRIRQVLDFLIAECIGLAEGQKLVDLALELES